MASRSMPLSDTGISAIAMSRRRPGTKVYGPKREAGKAPEAVALNAAEEEEPHPLGGGSGSSGEPHGPMAGQAEDREEQVGNPPPQLPPPPHRPQPNRIRKAAASGSRFRRGSTVFCTEATDRQICALSRSILTSSLTTGPLATCGLGSGSTVPRCCGRSGSWP